MCTEKKKKKKESGGKKFYADPNARLKEISDGFALVQTPPYASRDRPATGSMREQRSMW